MAFRSSRASSAFSVLIRIRAWPKQSASLSSASRMCLSAWRPDLLLLIADRYEMLAPATVALALRIPVAHIEGGEVSQGAIDDHVRNAITKIGAHSFHRPLKQRVSA